MDEQQNEELSMKKQKEKTKASAIGGMNQSADSSMIKPKSDKQ
jgi:hypothetical protein